MERPTPTSPEGATDLGPEVWTRGRLEQEMAGTFSNLSVHLVFSTKDRLPLMTTPVRDELFPYMGGIVKGLGGSIISVGGMPDHVHLVARLPTSLSVADVVRTVKTNSSKWMNEEFTTMKFGWQRGYGAFSVSHSALPAVVNYVRNQERHHRCRSFREELMALLTKNGIDYDERYLS
jgi:REP element-mobilizing transposase RayT